MSHTCMNPLPLSVHAIGRARQMTILVPRVCWKVHRLTMMQWSNLTKMWFIFQHSLPWGPHTSSISVAALWFLWYRRSHSDPRNSPKLQIWSNMSNTASQPSVFSCWGRENSHRDSKPVMQSIVTTNLCAGALSWWNRTPFINFPGCNKMSLATTFQNPELLIQCGFIWKETMQLVSGINACQASLMWHNSFLVSLWTFQPTLVHKPVLTN